MPFPNVPTLSDGQPADASVLNQPLQALTQRTQILLSMLEQLDNQARLVFRDVVVESGSLPGQPVWFDAQEQVFRPAAAALSADAGLDLAADSALWRGVIKEVGGTVGTVVPAGEIALPVSDWEAVIDEGSITPGRYYLSTNAGRITRERGTTAIYVGDLTSDGRMFLAGQLPTNLLNHVHHKFTLVGDPAGVPNTPSVGDPQNIPSPDDQLRGWLPVSEFTSFTVGNQIPSGAVFGYNLNHPDEVDLAAVFPPIPVENAEFSMDGQRLSDSRIVLNQFGIWWMTDDYGQVPWDPDYVNNQQAFDISYWTTRIPSDDSLYQTILDRTLQQIIDNFGQIGVRSLTVPNATDRLSISGQNGELEIINTGVRSLRGGFGIGTTSIDGEGTAAAGHRYRVRTELSIEQEVPRAPDPNRVLEPVNTQLVSGTSLDLYGDALNNDGDYADYHLYLGNDLPSGIDYRPSIRLSLVVDDDEDAPVVSGIVRVRVYVAEPGQNLSTDREEHVFNPQFVTGAPNTVQTQLLTSSNLSVSRGKYLVIRVEKPTGVGDPLPDDTIRVLNVRLSLARV